MKRIYLSVLIAACTLSACTNDRDIKADIMIKAKSEISFAGVNYAVKDKMVTLTGACPSQASKQKMLQAVQSIAVIKGITDNIRIAPVPLTNDLPMKLSVDSVLGRHPQVQGFVKHGEVTLHGYATQKDVKSLLSGIVKLHPDAVHNMITLK